LDLLSSITKKHGALLIFDEVMTGFRLGKAGVQGLEDLTPDLSCFGKVIGGGLPVGAFGGRADVMDYLAPIGPVYQAGTLSGNPLAMAAGLAQLRELHNRSGFARLDQLGAHFEKGLRQLLEEKGVPHRFNRVGSMFCLFFADREICLDKGIYLAPSPYETGFISLAHTEADLDDTLTVFGEVLAGI
jgi:glutamate-1-semialdehyde 2,1-aminomutase